MSNEISINQSQANFLVYKHTNKINGKVYIGITSRSVNLRWNNGKGYKDNSHFWTAIQKYGWDNFDHNIIQENLTELEALTLEENLILKYDSTNIEKGYNILLSSVKNHPHFTNESKLKLSLSHKGKKLTKEQKLEISIRQKEYFKNNPLSTEEMVRRGIKAAKTRKEKGYHHSEETKLKIKNNRIYKRGVENESFGKKRSNDTKLKISQSYVGEKNPLYGKKWFTNGVTQVITKICPEGFHPGRLPVSKETRKKQSLAKLSKNK